METEMECETVEKEACTTMREPVCSPTSETVSQLSPLTSHRWELS